MLRRGPNLVNFIKKSEKRGTPKESKAAACPGNLFRVKGHGAECPGESTETSGSGRGIFQLHATDFSYWLQFVILWNTESLEMWKRAVWGKGRSGI